MSMRSPRSSCTTACTRLPFIPTHAPTGSTSESRDTTAIFERPPGSRAADRIVTMPSYISGTSCSKSLSRSSVQVRESTIWEPLAFLLTSVT
jgi:hypothetical protein